ncbi:hypothetical protein DBR24_21010 [Pseudomonas sp. HMWF006]|nr:hypothetical protein DBR24_21010 [Pseudomonas sp. HMWF006]PTT73956.1 hypothetical protein DBR26_01705 [Pseudomonas sp. HMWF007]
MGATHIKRCSGYPLKYRPGKAVGIWAICPKPMGIPPAAMGRKQLLVKGSFWPKAIDRERQLLAGFSLSRQIKIEPKAGIFKVIF